MDHSNKVSPTFTALLKGCYCPNILHKVVPQRPSPDDICASTAIWLKLQDLSVPNLPIWDILGTSAET